MAIKTLTGARRRALALRRELCELEELLEGNPSSEATLEARYRLMLAGVATQELSDAIERLDRTKVAS